MKTLGVLMTMFTVAMFGVSQNQTYEITLLDSFEEVVDVYQAPSHIIAAPSVIATFETEEHLLELANQEVRPQIIILPVDEHLRVGDLTIQESLSVVYPKIIPAFKVESKEVAKLLAEALLEFKVKDVFIVSESSEVLIEARSIYPMIRGVLSYQGKHDLSLIREKAQNAEARVVLLPYELATKQNNEYLQKRAITTWHYSEDLMHHDIKVIASGTHGIVTNRYKEVYEFYQEAKENTIVRNPFIIAHRGLRNVAPENTIEAGVEAYEAGADIIELDVRLTKDLEVVVIHDADTERVSGQTVHVSNTYLRDLQKVILRNKDGSFTDVVIPTFEAFLERFKGLNMVLFVEIKESKTLLNQKVVELIEKHQMYDQVSVIAFNKTDLEEIKTLYPKMTRGLLVGGDIFAGSTKQAVMTALNLVVENNTTINPAEQTVTPEVVQALLHRGITIWPWTIVRGAMNRHLLTGSQGLTTDVSDFYQDKHIRIDQTVKIEAKIGDIIKLPQYTYTPKNEQKEHEYLYIVLKGDLFISEDHTITSSKEEVGYVYGYASIVLSNQTILNMMTEVIEVEFKKEPSGNHSLIIGGVLLVSVSAVLGVVFYKKRKK